MDNVKCLIRGNLSLILGIITKNCVTEQLINTINSLYRHSFKSTEMTKYYD